jgi:hypothetical protein
MTRRAFAPTALSLLLCGSRLGGSSIKEDVSLTPSKSIITDS